MARAALGGMRFRVEPLALPPRCALGPLQYAAARSISGMSPLYLSVSRYAIRSFRTF